MSISYYDQNADQFFADTAFADMSQARRRFLDAPPPGARVLDAGCGSGRDALAFREAGLDVTAFDGSAEMVRRARDHTGLEVLHLTFDDVRWLDAFEGIWSCASLLHVARAELPGVMARLRDALVAGGVWELSFKLGTGERVTGGRHFTDLDEAGAQALVAEVGGLEILALDVGRDVRPGREQDAWVNLLVRRAG